MSNTQDTQDHGVSEHLVRLVQVVFGLVVAQSLLLYRDVVVDPFSRAHSVALLALLSVYATTVASWIDWHPQMERMPYRITERGRLAESGRLISDLLVVIIYAYLLFTIERFERQPNADISRHLLGYPLVFLTYFLSGVARRWRYGPSASNLLPILGFGGVSALVVIDYQFDPSGVQLLSLNRQALNLVCLGSMLVLMLTYRLVRRPYSNWRDQRKRSGLRIAVDLDGVLGDQIKGVLPRVNQKFGTELREDDVTDWRLQIDGSDIAHEIGLALQDRKYVLGMRVHRGARYMLARLGDKHTVEITTARPDKSRAWTIEWLLRKRLPHDALVNAGEALKSQHGANILVDDYLGNIREFLRNTKGSAVLVVRPWNREWDDEINGWVSAGRLVVVKRLLAIPGAIRELTSRMAP